MSTTTPAIAELLRRVGFTWRDPGYWGLDVTGGLELALQPQILNAGDYQLQLYSRGVSVLRDELLVDVKLRPAPDTGA